MLEGSCYVRKAISNQLFRSFSLYQIPIWLAISQMPPDIFYLLCKREGMYYHWLQAIMTGFGHVWILEKKVVTILFLFWKHFVRDIGEIFRYLICKLLVILHTTLFNDFLHLMN